VKVRVGFGLGTRTLANDQASYGAVVDALEDLRFDSLWLSERINGDAPDPLVAMAFAAGRTTRLKFGTSVMVLPGRNPVLLAKELATLDRLSNGRLLPAFGLGVVDPREQQAFGVRREDRASIFDEALPLIRRLWTEDRVDHHGSHFQLEGIDVRPKPVQQPPDVWLGGRAPSELRRIGRLADGWLPSFCTPADVEQGLPTVVEAAAAHGRAIDPEHIGALITYRTGPLPDALAAFISTRTDADPDEVVPYGTDGLAELVGRFVAVGASKFVVLPLVEPDGVDGWLAELARLAEVVLPLQT